MTPGGSGVTLWMLCCALPMQTLNDVLWGRVLIVALLAIGLVISARTRWVQLRYFGSMFALLGSAFQQQGNHLSSFQALVLSVAGRVGAGNIAGVAVAISLGGPPALTLAAAWPLPDGLDELTFAGWLAGSPLPVVSCSHAPLLVPAGAELVLEGFAEPDQQLMEGPFGNHTGGYDPAGVAAKVTITRITRRRNPLLPITVVGPPPQEDCWMMLGWERLLAALLSRLVPGGG